jgi:hypothetical protein
MMRATRAGTHTGSPVPNPPASQATSTASRRPGGRPSQVVRHPVAETSTHTVLTRRPFAMTRLSTIFTSIGAMSTGTLSDPRAGERCQALSAGSRAGDVSGIRLVELRDRLPRRRAVEPSDHSLFRHQSRRREPQHELLIDDALHGRAHDRRREAVDDLDDVARDRQSLRLNDFGHPSRIGCRGLEVYAPAGIA